MVDGPDSEPQYVGLAVPGPFFSHSVYASEYYYVQALSKQFSVLAGKISDIFIPDQTLFADSYKFYFANFNFNKSPQTTNFYDPTAWAALGILTPTNWLAIGGGVLDPNSQSDNFDANAFNKVNLYATAVVSYQIGGLPGQFSPAFNWSNKPKMNLDFPFGTLTPGQIRQAVGVLAGSGMTNGLPINSVNDSDFLIANLSQYLYMKDDPTTIAQKLKSGQVINGIGIFGRAGFAPASSNPITWDASVALAAHGISDERPYDSFGVAFYYNAISDDLKNDVSRLTAHTVDVKNESGIEAFYDFAVTPAIRIIPSYQHIWNPLTATVATNQSHADVFLARLTVVW